LFQLIEKKYTKTVYDKGEKASLNCIHFLPKMKHKRKNERKKNIILYIAIRKREKKFYGIRVSSLRMFTILYLGRHKKIKERERQKKKF